MKTDLDAVSAAIADALGQRISIQNVRSVPGGCINRCYLVDAGKLRFFVKLNSPARLDMFDAEADGLAALSRATALKVPKVICSGRDERQSWLVLEALELGSSTACGAALGEALARMHAMPQGRFGWHRDNYIGETAQLNDHADDWIGFFAGKRLIPQLEAASRNGLSRRSVDAGMRLAQNLEAFFVDYQPQASLLHGDLWAGNAACTVDGCPVIFDPAVYTGDREADLAMTRLFGGFDRSFYSSYDAVFPIDPGFETRVPLYNCYHILNHFNLFGGGYGERAGQMIQRLLEFTSGITPR